MKAIKHWGLLAAVLLAGPFLSAEDLDLKDLFEKSGIQVRIYHQAFGGKAPGSFDEFKKLSADDLAGFPSLVVFLPADAVIAKYSDEDVAQKRRQVRRLARTGSDKDMVRLSSGEIVDVVGYTLALATGAPEANFRVLIVPLVPRHELIPADAKACVLWAKQVYVSQKKEYLPIFRRADILEDHTVAPIPE